jgi:hypothetical protein
LIIPQISTMLEDERQNKIRKLIPPTNIGKNIKKSQLVYAIVTREDGVMLFEEISIYELFKRQWNWPDYSFRYQIIQDSIMRLYNMSISWVVNRLGL